MRATYGSFTSGEGAGATPLTAEDISRLNGTYLHKGQRTDPHVMTRLGPFLIGQLVLERRGRCLVCGENKLTFHRVHQWTASFERWCFGCGRGQ